MLGGEGAEAMEIKVGGDIEAWCTTCRTMKWHVIVSVVDEKPAKVECVGCHKQHGFKAQPPGTARPRTARAAKTATLAPAPIDDLLAKLAAGQSEARVYSPNDTYAAGEFVRHPTFGVGLVTIPAAQRVEVAFESGRKLLVHRRGEPMAPTLERPPPRADDDSRTVTDAPPPDAPPK